MAHWNLVTDVIAQIFGYCSLQDLKSLSLCSSFFNEEVTESLWKEVSIPAEVLDEKDLKVAHATKLSKLVYTKVLRLTDVPIFRGRRLINYNCILDHCNPNVVKRFIRQRENDLSTLVLTLVSTLVFKTTFEKLPNLEQVTISGKGIAVAAISHVTILENIRSLNLSNTCVDNEILQMICHSLYTLELLNLSATKVTSKLLLLLKRLPCLSILILSRCEIGDVGASRIAECEHLTSLDVSQCYLSNFGLGSLAKLTNLTALVVTEMKTVPTEYGYHSGYSDEGVSHLLSLKKLKELAIGQEGLTFDSISKLSGLRYLTSLSLRSASVNPNCLRSLSSLQDLVELNLFNCRGVNDDGIQYLPSLTKLRVLQVTGCFTNLALFHISQLLLLNHLTFRNFVDMADEDNLHDQPGVNDAGLVHLARMSHLQTLEILANLTSKGFETISEITSLKKLDVSFMALNNDAFMYFSRLPNLKTFVCGDNGLLEEPDDQVSDDQDDQVGDTDDPWTPEDSPNDGDMKTWEIVQWEHLAPLNAENQWQNDADQNNHWNQLPFDEGDLHPVERLERVQLLETQLELERLSEMPTDECMYHVGNMSSLEYLDIKRAPVTNDCLPHLRRLQNLKELICIDTRLTAEALAELNVKRIVMVAGKIP